jgi:hypothetical protein
VRKETYINKYEDAYLLGVTAMPGMPASDVKELLQLSLDASPVGASGASGKQLKDFEQGFRNFTSAITRLRDSGVTDSVALRALRNDDLFQEVVQRDGLYNAVKTLEYFDSDQGQAAAGTASQLASLLPNEDPRKVRTEVYRQLYSRQMKQGVRFETIMGRKVKKLLDNIDRADAAEQTGNESAAGRDAYRSFAQDPSLFQSTSSDGAAAAPTKAQVYAGIIANGEDAFAKLQSDDSWKPIFALEDNAAKSNVGAALAPSQQIGYIESLLADAALTPQQAEALRTLQMSARKGADTALPKPVLGAQFPIDALGDPGRIAPGVTPRPSGRPGVRRATDYAALEAFVSRATRLDRGTAEAREAVNRLRNLDYALRTDKNKVILGTTARTATITASRVSENRRSAYKSGDTIKLGLPGNSIEVKPRQIWSIEEWAGDGSFTRLRIPSTEELFNSGVLRLTESGEIEVNPDASMVSPVSQVAARPQYILGAEYNLASGVDFAKAGVALAKEVLGEGYDESASEYRATNDAYTAYRELTPDQRNLAEEGAKKRAGVSGSFIDRTYLAAGLEAKYALTGSDTALRRARDLRKGEYEKQNEALERATKRSRLLLDRAKIEVELAKLSGGGVDLEKAIDAAIQEMKEAGVLNRTNADELGIAAGTENLDLFERRMKALKVPGFIDVDSGE